jgi:S1-C subfamily serine protease
VRRGTRTYVLSNNHVLANEDQGKAGDWILQRAAYDGGTQPAQRVARLRYWVRLKLSGPNLVDCALAQIEEAVAYDASRLRGISNGADKRLAGLGPAVVDEGTLVYKIGRTTGATEGRVSAFDLDNLVVNYDIGNLRFDGQIEIEGTGRHAFSDGGDSGSLIVNAKMQAVALLFAGGETGGTNGLGLTFANPIGAVLKALNATLLS